MSINSYGLGETKEQSVYFDMSQEREIFLGGDREWHLSFLALKGKKGVTIFIVTTTGCSAVGASVMTRHVAWLCRNS